jgi:hypothetical protein
MITLKYIEHDSDTRLKRDLVCKLGFHFESGVLILNTSVSPIKTYADAFFKWLHPYGDSGISYKLIITKCMCALHTVAACKVSTS